MPTPDPAHTAAKDALRTLLSPVQQFITTLDLADPQAAMAALNTAYPLSGALMQDVRAKVRAGVDEGWLAHRGAPPVRFSRLAKPSDAMAQSIDVVSMTGAGPGHTHPTGEVDLSFARTEGATFDGTTEGWLVYAPGSWHTPTTNGHMDIVYFLPDGAIAFDSP